MHTEVLTRTMKTLLFIILLTGSLINVSPGTGHAREQFAEHQVKAAFLYNLTSFIDWPNDSFENESSPFRIVILGDAELSGALEKLTLGETVDAHPIEVIHIDLPEDLPSAHLLFIADKFKNDVGWILSKVNRRGLLTVSDFTGFNRAGGGIALLKNNNRLELHLSQKILERYGLRCSSKLLRLAIIVEGAWQ